MCNVCSQSENKKLCLMCGSWVDGPHFDCRNCAARDGFEDDGDYYSEDEIIGYQCLGCGSTQDHPGECDTCTGYSVEPMYF